MQLPVKKFLYSSKTQQNPNINITVYIMQHLLKKHQTCEERETYNQQINQWIKTDPEGTTMMELTHKDFITTTVSRL